MCTQHVSTAGPVTTWQATLTLVSTTDYPVQRLMRLNPSRAETRYDSGP